MRIVAGILAIIIVYCLIMCALSWLTDPWRPPVIQRKPPKAWRRT
jgi:hypothetical protein